MSGTIVKSQDEYGRDRYLNTETRRCVVVALLGAACYAGEITDGQYCGTHMGIATTDEDIREWLSGGSPKLHRVYTKQDESH